MAKSGPTGIPDLDAAIASASQRYGVPADLLGGIWRIESGSTFPNPAVNSSGYGGLFGTTNGLASTQAQADEAASVLAAGFKASGGQVAGALSYYNSGRTTGGYTTVPGQSTFGTIPVPQGGGGTLGDTPSYSRGTRPSGSSSIFSDIAKAGESALDIGTLGASGLLGAPTGFVPSIGSIGGLWDSVAGGLSDTVGFLKMLAWLLKPVHWLMMFEILFGVLLMVMGLFFLGQEAAGVESSDDIGGAKDVAKTVGLGALVPVAGEARAVKAGTGARRANQARRKAKSIGSSTPGAKRRVGFVGAGTDGDRRPRAGAPGSSRLAAGDDIPF